MPQAMNRRRSGAFGILPTAILLSMALLLAGPAMAYVVVLKDGSQITTQKAPEKKGDEVLLILQSGVQASYPIADVDFERTQALNKGTNLSNARVLERVKSRPDPVTADPNADKPSFSDLLNARKKNLALPEVKRRPEDGERPVDLELTKAGFVDLTRLSRDPLSDADLAGAINTYLKGQGSEAKVYRGSREGWPLVEMSATSEASVFKALKDAAGCLVQVKQGRPQLDGFELLILTDSRVRAGQFSLTQELANELLTGKVGPPAFFLRYVEF